jgi:hypothetical protein
MALIYDENPRRGASGAFNPLRFDATQQWLTHYANALTLEFFARNGTRHEKTSAQRELIVAQRKMNYWKNQPHWSESDAISGKNALDQRWKR